MEQNENNAPVLRQAGKPDEGAQNKVPPPTDDAVEAAKRILEAAGISPEKETMMDRARAAGAAVAAGDEALEMQRENELELKDMKDLKPIAPGIGNVRIPAKTIEVELDLVTLYDLKEQRKGVVFSLLNLVMQSHNHQMQKEGMLKEIKELRSLNLDDKEVKYGKKLSGAVGREAKNRYRQILEGIKHRKNMIRTREDTIGIMEGVVRDSKNISQESLKKCGVMYQLTQQVPMYVERILYLDQLIREKKKRMVINFFKVLFHGGRRNRR